jgi:acyl dehydratase
MKSPMKSNDTQTDDDSVTRLQGLFFEDLEPGRVIQSPGRTVTEADIVAFAALSGDFNPLHVDEVYARRTPFRGRIAHGMLVQSIAGGLVNQTGAFHQTIAALAELHIRYKAAVRAGDTIQARLVVTERESDPGHKRGWVHFDGVVSNQDGETVIESEWRTIVRRRP